MADYDNVIEKVFFANYKKGSTVVEFGRQELLDTAAKLGITIKNIGDTIYSYRFRKSLPAKILATQTKDMEWIEGVVDVELERREERADEARASARRVNSASRFLAASGVYLGR